MNQKFNKNLKLSMIRVNKIQLTIQQ